MKIVITGASGQLGQDLTEILAPKNEVFSFSRRDMDVSNYKKAAEAISSIEPNVVIHSAAFTNVDECETNPDKAYLINAIGARNVALACQIAQAAMVYPSTDYLFDGKKGSPYIEFDEPNPLSVYGKSKLAGEKYVQSLLGRYYIIRTSWLYGRGKNFVQTILKLATEKRELSIVSDQIGSPTSTYDLARKIALLIDEPLYGTYHITNQGSCSWYEFAKEILAVSAVRNVIVKPITTQELKRPAPRPAYSVLKNYCLELMGLELLRPYQEALQEYLDKAK